MSAVRVFPRRTSATPVDDRVRFGPPGMLDEADRVEVSVAFTWDIPRAEELARQWEHVAPVEIGGPATGAPGGDFVPGRYLKHGMVITSRGCPNRCWFCSVWRREGQQVRELPITDGWNVLDDNLLACSETHIRAVFAMLQRQPVPVTFTGGLEAARLKPWHVEALAGLHLGRIYFAYDTPNDLEPLIEAGKLLRDLHTPASRRTCAYVLCGYLGDTMEDAEGRMLTAYAHGFWPFAMLWRDEHGQANPRWRAFQRTWARPAATAAHMQSMGVPT